ncbi:CotH kinase family protein [candidate division KSB1 bacterium]|nr:CotH kinase family protein [candidate division KSB1 bacterium]
MSSNISSIEDEYDVDQQNCPVPDCQWWYEQMGESTHDGDYPDWIELYNAGSNSINLAGYGLSDDLADLYKWTFPNVTIAPKAYLLVFASGKDRKEPHEVAIHMHTNFKIDRSGETILLTDNNGQLCDKIETGDIPIDLSLGRFPDGTEQWVTFLQPTPAQSNTSTPFPGFNDTVSFSHAAGFYSNVLSLVLSAASSTAKIYYTLDGENPSPDSFLYTQPINISKTTVVKAATFENSVVSSKVKTQTYLINEHFTMPVFSISTPPDNLWDDEIGIYSPGINADEGNRIANYWQDWERPVHVEFFEPNGTSAFSINAGIKIFGWGSRANAQKSLSIMIRDKYGLDELHYQLFPDLDIRTFKSFVLRAAGTDWQKTFFRDPLASSLVQDKNVDRQAFRPAILFLNGEYWGIQNIREKLNEDYIASHFGFDKENVDIISRYWRRSYPVVSEGDDHAYLDLENYLENNDINQSFHYDYIKSVVDIDNYIDYCVTQIYCANYDWPGNNNKCWRPRTANGLWRWFMYDLDYTFNSNGNNDFQHNTLAHATQTDNMDWPNPPHTTFLLRKMLESTQFSNDFINRFADYLNTNFDHSRVNAKIDQMSSLFEPEIERHIERWRRYSSLRSKNEWEQQIDVLRTFSSRRSTFIYRQICDYFSLQGWDYLELDISSPGSGKIKLNSILIDVYPWSGDYFFDIPVQLTALPNAGYRFSHWRGLSSGDSPSQQINVVVPDVSYVMAHFEKANNNQNMILFNEINYNSLVEFDVDDWIELYNPHSSAIDVSNWLFLDSDDTHKFIIPKSTIIPADGYLVLCRNISAFQDMFPAVKNCLGDFDFGLNSQDIVRLFDDVGNNIDSVAFGNSAPWPAQPDGHGPTLSLRAPHLDNSLPQNWTASLGYGTPGFSNTLASDSAVRPSAMPVVLSLAQNYPNPFNAITTFSFTIPQTGQVNLCIYDIRGRKLMTLVNKTMFPGNYSVKYDASAIASGLYFYRLTVGSEMKTKRMTVLK